MSTVNALRVTSRDNPQLARIRRLARDAGAYRRLGELWLEGEHLGQALQERGVQASCAVLSEAAWTQPALRALAATARRVLIVPDTLFADLSALPSPSAVGFVIPTASSPALDASAPTVVLDRIQDAGNVGSILRSAAAFGVRQVVALGGTASLWSPKVLRAGQGAHFALSLIEGVDSAQLPGLLHVPLVAADVRADGVLGQVHLPWPCAWVFGHEGQGVADALLVRAALRLRILQPGGQESLNVAAAAAVCLYEGVRQRAGVTAAPQ